MTCAHRTHGVSTRAKKLCAAPENNAPIYAPDYPFESIYELCRFARARHPTITSLHCLQSLLGLHVLRGCARMPGKRTTWRGTYAEETAFALCPRWRLPQWLHLIPDLGYVSDLA